VRVSSGAEALDLARDTTRYNLVITSMHVGDMDAATLARRLKDAGIETPVVLLAYDSRELRGVPEAPGRRRPSIASSSGRATSRNPASPS